MKICFNRSWGKLFGLFAVCLVVLLFVLFAFSACSESGSYVELHSGDNGLVDCNTACGHVAGPEATCTTAQICAVCKVELAAALGHEWMAPDTSGWYWIYTCENCGEEERRPANQ